MIYYIDIDCVLANVLCSKWSCAIFLVYMLDINLQVHSTVSFFCSYISRNLLNYFSTSHHLILTLLYCAHYSKLLSLPFLFFFLKRHQLKWNVQKISDRYCETFDSLRAISVTFNVNICSLNDMRLAELVTKNYWNFNSSFTFET